MNKYWRDVSLQELLYYEHWTDKQIYFYVILLILSYLSMLQVENMRMNLRHYQTHNIV